MHRTAADVVLTLEVKLLAGYPKDVAEQAARRKKWNLAVEACHVTAVGGKSAGVAIATRCFIGMSSSKVVDESQKLHQPGHFGMKHVGALGRGGCHFGSVYFTSMVGQGGITAKWNLDLLETIALTLFVLKGAWIIGGDWNSTPAELIATGWVKKVGGVVHTPSSETCNGKVYFSSSSLLACPTSCKAPMP